MEKDEKSGLNDFESNVIQRLSRMEPMVESTYKAINGNGHKGLAQQVAELESRTSVLESKHTLTAMIVGWFISTGIALYSLFK